ncbi:TPA: hypothetical protein CPT96_08890 [Candidatus Gastranaerophilales bacterium HUM_10]|jgi:hypothetical protein|nr:MAG TPA: hypothetical protein CPT96_08890 [Candidatus Gastranaerophilales bacterium HUM_10]
MELTSLQTSLTRTSDKQLLLLKASDSSQQSSPTFKLDEVQDILLEEGFDRTLDTFKEWEKTRKFYPIKIVTDANTGKTTISGEYNGVSLEFIGTCERDHELIVLDQVSEQKPESEINLTTLSEAASTIMNKITTYITGSEINMYAKIYSKIHTEFGLDSNGKIIFQESSTQEVYDYLKDQIVTDMTEQYPEEVAALGGAEGLERILQAAWIETYSSFNSSQSNDTKAFVNKVVANLQTILSKISNNPELLEVYTSHTNYADKTLTDGLENYKNSSAITYSDADIYMDGSVHIQDTQSDKLYQQTMSSLLDKLKAKYPKLDESVIAKLFKQAQVNALNNCANNTADCPYGTDNGGNDRVYDTKLDWGGKDSRKGDKNKILMQELVQLVLYHFDKLLYAQAA